MGSGAAGPFVDLDALVVAFQAWIERHATDLTAVRCHPAGDLDLAVATTGPVLRALYDGGWTRLGWPVEVGGLGGSALQRAVVYEELAAAGYVIPEVFSAVEVIAPMLVRFAPALATACLTATLRGEETW